jgi:enoyl-CoA hydratase
MTSQSLLLVEKAAEGYAVVTLNRPEAMNALSRGLCDQLDATIRALEADPAIRLLILTGAGRAFCAGVDLKELGQSASIVDALDALDPVTVSLAGFSGPIIGAINGAAITGGFELALACDVLIASTEARFADTHARVGIVAAWGLSQKLSRVIGVYRARELSLSGNFLPAAQAEAWGLVNRVVAPEALLDTARALARDMLSADPATLVTYRRLINDGFALPFGEAMQLEAKVARSVNGRVTAADIERRREAVRARGQAQARS